MGKKFKRGGKNWNIKSREVYPVGACLQKRWEDCVNRGKKCKECVQVMSWTPSNYERRKHERIAP